MPDPIWPTEDGDEPAPDVPQGPPPSTRAEPPPTASTPPPAAEPAEDTSYQAEDQQLAEPPAKTESQRTAELPAPEPNERATAHWPDTGERTGADERSEQPYAGERPGPFDHRSADRSGPTDRAAQRPNTHERPAGPEHQRPAPAGNHGRFGAPPPTEYLAPAPPPGSAERTQIIPLPPRPLPPPVGDRTQPHRTPAPPSIPPPSTPPRATPRPPVDSPTAMLPAVGRSEPADDAKPAPEPTPAKEAPSEPAARPGARRGGRVLVTLGALVVVLGLAVGVVFGVPGLATSLGLRVEPAPATAPPPAPVAFQPALRAPDATVPAPSASGVGAALVGPAGSSALGTLTGKVIDPATGQVLWERSAGSALVPASTGKLLTAAAALLAIDHTAQLTTKVVQGERPGTVVVVGGGDPTVTALPAGKDSVYPGAAHLDDLVAQVKASGVQVSTVQADLSRYTGAPLAPGWDNADVAGGYIAPMVPMMLDGARSVATKGTTPRSDSPARTFADVFAKRLGAAAATDRFQVSAPAGAKVLGEVRSAPLVELVDNLLQTSDNVLAEAVAREVAVATGADPSFDGAGKATLKVLQDNGFDTSGTSLSDGSGLSNLDKTSAALLAELLRVAAADEGTDPRSAKLRPLLGGLPVAGGSGTLSTRYTTGAAAVGRGWVRAKTGTLPAARVNSLAGVVLDQDGRLLVFAFITAESDPVAARPALDEVIAALRQCGCR